MKNSHRSDRELAKASGISQPTVNRLIGRLQKKGVIKEYTMVPDFGKLGFNLMAIVMFRLKPISPRKLRSCTEQHMNLKIGDATHTFSQKNPRTWTKDFRARQDFLTYAGKF